MENESHQIIGLKPKRLTKRPKNIRLEMPIKDLCKLV
jgi:hypothetical protein